MRSQKLPRIGLVDDGGITISIIGLIVIFGLWHSPILMPLAIPLFVFVFGKTKLDVLSSLLVLGFTVVLIVFGFRSVLDGYYSGLPLFVLSAYIFTIFASSDRERASLWSYAGLALFVYASVPSLDFFDNGIIVINNVGTFDNYPLPAKIVAAGSIVLAFYFLFKQRNLRAVSRRLNADGSRKLIILVNTKNIAGAMLPVFVSAYFVTFLLSDPGFFSGSFGLLGLILIIALNTVYILYVLKQLSQSTTLKVEPTGRVRVVTDFNASGMPVDSKEYIVESIGVTHDPDPYTVANTRTSNSSNIIAGGSGLEGTGMLVATTAMAAMDAVGRSATRLTSLWVSSQMNRQKTINGCYMFINLATGDDDKRTIVLSRISKGTAAFIEEQLRV